MGSGCKVMNVRGKKYTCAIELTLDIISGKWKPIILFQLADKGTLRFNELKNLLSGITQKMLTQQLRELEAYEIIERKIYAQVPPKVEYFLTDEGKSIIPLLKMMCSWGKKHYDKYEFEYTTNEIYDQENKSV